jgi:hypothetical protein
LLLESGRGFVAVAVAVAFIVVVVIVVVVDVDLVGVVGFLKRDIYECLKMDLMKGVPYEL